MADGRPVYAAVASVLTAVVVGIGVARAPVVPDPPDQTGVVPEVPLSEVRLDSINTKRTPFCDNISAKAVVAAVGEGAEASSYSSGDDATLEPGLTDISHEFGCVYTAGAKVARVWVFAAPITPYDAATLVREESADASCVPAGVLKFGEPGVVLDCASQGQRVLRALGRIGDAWVHCELSGPAAPFDAKLVSRGQRWCVAAAFAME